MRSPVTPRRRALAVTLLLWLAAGAAAALDPERSPTQYQLQHWGVPQGLPQSVVRAIAQDASGYLWIGTQEGLARFDGVRFTAYDRSVLAAAGIRNSRVLSILPRPEGLWFGTFGGLGLLAPDGAIQTWTTAKGLPHDWVFTIVPRSAGGYWLGTLGGVARIADGRVEAVPCPAVGEQPVLSLLETGPESLLVGAGEGLFRCAGGVAERVALAGELTRSILRPPGGDGLLVATDSGVFALAGDTVRRTWTPADGLPGGLTLRVFRDRDGNVWVGTEGGLARLRGDGAERFPADHPLGRVAIRALFEDREASLWVGTDAGMFRLHDASFVLVGEEEGLRPPVALSVFEDAAGGVWTGTERGLFEVRDGRAEPLRGTPVDGSTVWALAEQPAGRLWVGTADGLWSVESGRWQRWSGLANDDVRSLWVDPAGRLWVGSGDGGDDAAGVDRLEGDRFVPVLHGGEVDYLVVYGLGGDERRGWWIATASQGLLHLGGDGKTRRVGVAEGLGDQALSLLVDADGTVWAGSEGQGLFRVRDGKVFRFHRGNGLPDELINQIVDDGRGALWLGSNRGIARVPRSELDAVAAGRSPRLAVTFHDSTSGLELPETNGGNQPAAMRSRDGRLWFATMAGVAVYDPERPRRNALAPPVVVEELRADGEPVAPADGARLPAATRRVEVRFVGLSYRAPERVRYRYRLLGFDPRWVELGEQRTATFTNLPPGPLTLEVLAANEDGVWSARPARLAFSRAPLLHEAWWFLPAIAATLLLLAWAAHRLRLRQLRSRFQAVLDERARLGRELHDTIAQGLAGIGMQVETAAALIARDRERAERHLGRAGELVRSSHEDVRRSIRALRPTALEGRDVGAALVGEATEAAGRHGVQLAVHRRGRPRELPPETETEVLRIGQEAVVNALRHGRPQRLEVTIAWHRRRLVVTVRDDGAGFDPAAPRLPRTSGGMGLYGMGERAAKIGAALAVDSRPGAGTTVRLEVPLGGRRSMA